VNAPQITLAVGQAEVELEVTATANAALGDKGDVLILGTAPAAGNQQQPSPSFTLRVVKK
jgi:hypothetical protein